jgi:hypothetical protein
MSQDVLAVFVLFIVPKKKMESSYYRNSLGEISFFFLN